MTARAINAAVAKVGEDRVLAEIHPPEITPNPAVEGWPLGTA